MRRIRAVHIRYPDIGLKMSWERLEEVYGAPEVIEKALLDRIESFSKITKQDPLKLRELRDLLQEVLSAKSEGYLSGLSYFDTSRGVNPIVKKLPPHKKNGSIKARSIKQITKFHFHHFHSSVTLCAQKHNHGMTLASTSAEICCGLEETATKEVCRFCS